MIFVWALALSAAEIWTVKGPVVTHGGASFRLPTAPSNIAVAAVGTALFATAAGSTLWVRQASGKLVRFPRIEAPNYRDAIYADVAISPSGRAGAVVLRRGSRGPHSADASEIGGAVVLLDLVTLRATLIDESGVAMSPQFSPSGRQLLVSYETGFYVFDTSSGRAVFKFSQVPELSESWSHALGWLSETRIALTMGRDFADAERKSAWAVDIGPGPPRLIPDAAPAGLHSIVFPYALRRSEAGWDVFPLTGSSTAHISRKSADLISVVSPAKIP